MDKPKTVVFAGYTYRLDGGYYRRRKWPTPLDTKRPDLVKGDGGHTNLHRAIWTHHFGPIPEGYHIHHKDGDGTNNDLDNLELMNRSEHNRMHTKAAHHDGRLKSNGEFLRRWAQTEEGKLSQREQGRRSWETRVRTEVRCTICGTPFMSYKSDALVCGGNCKQKRLYRLRRPGQEIKVYRPRARKATSQVVP